MGVPVIPGVGVGNTLGLGAGVGVAVGIGVGTGVSVGLGLKVGTGVEVGRGVGRGFTLTLSLSSSSCVSLEKNSSTFSLAFSSILSRRLHPPRKTDRQNTPRTIPVPLFFQPLYFICIPPLYSTVIALL